MMNSSQIPLGAHLLFFDGHCGLCEKSVQFVLRHDKKKVFLFAPLQGRFASDFLAKHGKKASLLDTVYVVRDYGTQRQSIDTKSTAVFSMLDILGGVWRMFTVGRVLKRSWADAIYDALASSRHSFFGTWKRCKVVPKVLQERFISDDIDVSL